MRLLLPLLALVAFVDASKLLGQQACSLDLQAPVVQSRRACLLNLRGGEDGDDDIEEDDLDGLDEDTVGAGAEDNPFLGMPGAGAGAGGPGLQDLASTLQNPEMLQDALKELQDPAVQQQVKQMMEDPAFQESMKAYMEQITKDPQFQELKKQTEEMMKQEGFMEQMQQAFASLGGAAGEEGEEK
eukprot:CAMPEP_0115863500 /NCGR_PEP_ID=MMETSP0287-20121206/18720_1 /TAXON_ID=412157 /ORGANISM="Chrysochromulina rotalis, Strain UIO044" /LENGTH=184 /DNA_ID=CAMNT_0003317947 /DNA_START=22 /DNA_END=576 /DNA_ORIENTATION=+